MPSQQHQDSPIAKTISESSNLTPQKDGIGTQAPRRIYSLMPTLERPLRRLDQEEHPRAQSHRVLRTIIMDITPLPGLELSLLWPNMI